MLTVIAEIRTRPGQHHRQAVLDQFAKIVPARTKAARTAGSSGTFVSWRSSFLRLAKNMKESATT